MDGRRACGPTGDIHAVAPRTPPGADGSRGGWGSPPTRRGDAVAALGRSAGGERDRSSGRPDRLHVHRRPGAVGANRGGLDRGSRAMGDAATGWAGGPPMTRGTALVTGAARGIGAATALTLASRGV